MFKIIFIIFLCIIAIFLIWQIIAERRRNRKEKEKRGSNFYKCGCTYNRKYTANIYKNLIKTYGYIPKSLVKTPEASRRTALTLADIESRPKRKLLKHKSTKHEIHKLRSKRSKNDCFRHPIFVKLRPDK